MYILSVESVEQNITGCWSCVSNADIILCCGERLSKPKLPNLPKSQSNIAVTLATVQRLTVKQMATTANVGRHRIQGYRYQRRERHLLNHKLWVQVLALGLEAARLL